MRDLGTLSKDPFYLVIVGVAGQGNVLISQFIGEALVNDGYFVTMSQTYTTFQRGGWVANYICISRDNQYSPLIPRGNGDIIIGMEPMETIRMLVEFSNPDVVTIFNPQPIYPVTIASGKATYPSLDTLMKMVKALSGETWVINATKEAQKLGNPLLTNMILLGALVGLKYLPIDKELLSSLIRERFPNAVKLNMAAFDKGLELIKDLTS